MKPKSNESEANKFQGLELLQRTINIRLLIIISLFVLLVNNKIKIKLIIESLFITVNSAVGFADLL